MKVAKPIRDKETIKEILDVYPENSRNHILLLYCLNTGLRISDVLQTKVGEALSGSYQLNEQKTSKAAYIDLNDNLVGRISRYVQNEGLESEDWLFPNEADRSEHIKRTRAHQIISHSGDMIGVRLSAHSLRKTFGYYAHKEKGVTIGELMTIFNHSSQTVTLRYIGVEEDSIRETRKSMDIGL